MLALRDVEVVFGATSPTEPEGRPALRLDALSLTAGARLALVGASGGGKSTVLRVIAGLVPFSGEVRIDGELVTASNLGSVRRKLGYVIQDGGLFPHLSARDNVTLLARDVGRSRDEIAARTRFLTDLVGLPHAHLDRAPHELSGGERQRVAIMRALFLEPALLLLDEPLGALDPLVRRRLQDDLRTIFEETKKTVLLVTHDLAEAGYLADDLAVLEAGRLVQRGSYEQLGEAPASEYVRDLLAAYVPRTGGRR